LDIQSKLSHNNLFGGFADFGYEFFFMSFLKSRFQLTFRYVQNCNSYLD
jgi:hypothetical protein